MCARERGQKVFFNTKKSKRVHRNVKKRPGNGCVLSTLIRSWRCTHVITKSAADSVDCGSCECLTSHFLFKDVFREFCGFCVRIKPMKVWACASEVCVDTWCLGCFLTQKSRNSQISTSVHVTACLFVCQEFFSVNPVCSVWGRTFSGGVAWCLSRWFGHVSCGVFVCFLPLSQGRVPQGGEGYGRTVCYSGA